MALYLDEVIIRTRDTIGLQLYKVSCAEYIYNFLFL